MTGLFLCLALSCTVGAWGADNTANSGYRVDAWTVSTAGGNMTGEQHRVTAVGSQACPAGRCAFDTRQLESGYAIPEVVVQLLQFALSPGWNLKGAPGATARTTDEIFRGAAGAPVKVGNIRYWDAELQDYVEGDDADPLVGRWGFWVFSYWGGQSRPSETLADPVTSWVDDLLEGWNLYSPPYYVTVPQNNDVLVVWRWNAVDGSYELVYPGQNLIPGHGYWILKQAL
jgi:hypothetical protein